MPKYAWMKACLTGICCCLLLAGCGEKQGSSDRGLMRLPEEAAAFQQEDRVAVIAGIDAYAPQSNFRPLSYAVADATALKAAFEKHGYKVKLLTDGQAKKHFILQAIQEAGKLLEPEKGTLVFAFTGHGFAGKTTEGEDENFLAVDGTTDYDLANSGLGLEEVKTALKATKARRNMVFIDACRDNPLKDRDKSKASGISLGFAELAASEGLNILYSTAPGDISVELPEFQHGLFTHFLLDGLDGKAAQNGLVLFDGLADYVTKQVKDYSFEKLPQTQKPYRSGESSGQFLVAALPNYTPSANPAPVPIATLTVPTQSLPIPDKLPEPEKTPSSEGSISSGQVNSNIIGQEHTGAVASITTPKQEAAKLAAEKAAKVKSEELAKSTNADSGTISGVTSGYYAIQLSASSDKSKAEAVAATFKAEGYKTSVVAVKVDGLSVYRAVIGGYADKYAATAAQAKMKIRYKPNPNVQNSFVSKVSE